MTPTAFCYWLNGWLELGNPDSLNKQQIDIIKQHMALVLTNVTGAAPEETSPCADPDIYCVEQEPPSSLRPLSEEEMSKVTPLSPEVLEKALRTALAKARRGPGRGRRLERRNFGEGIRYC